MASWSRLSYARRLFLWLLGYSLLLVGGFVWFQYHREREFKAAELNSRLQLINRIILSEIASGTPPGDVSLPFVHVDGGLRVSVIDSEGRLVYDNSLDSLTSANHRERSEIARAMTVGEGFTVRRHSASTGLHYFYSATSGDDGYVVRTAVPYTLSLRELLRADFGFLWTMGAVTLVMCVLGFLATRRLGMTVTRLRRFAERAERGERVYDTPSFPDDELGAISGHIVRLYAGLQNAVAQRDREHRAALHEQREKERIKKQLTNNINHELKTPVASIQVCLETLLGHRDLPDAKREEFLRRCLDNAERLRRLLGDVSVLTRMDDAPASVAMEPVDLADVVADVVEECDPIAAAAGMEIDSRIGAPLPMRGNRQLLASVFRNLIDNAVAYSGGDRVTITADADGPDSVVVSVRDNGCGVGEEHLVRLFERFYRVDKGRSRATGGTGLGLSIVKNAVMIHGGSIKACPGPGCGLEFVIRLRLDGGQGSS